MITRIALVVACACLCGVGRADGQPVPPATGQGTAGVAVRPGSSARDPGRAGAFELSFSTLFLAPSTLGTSEAELTANDTRGSAYRLFTATGDLAASMGIEARAGYHLTRMFAVEGGVTYSRPTVSVSLANDAEGAAALDMSGETESQFFVDVSLVAYPMRRGAAGGRLRPFVGFGAGYLRELHGQSGATAGYYSKDTGQVYHVGGGARYDFHPRRSGLVKAYGLRFDGRYYFRKGGFSFDGAIVRTFAAGVGLVIAF